MPSPTLHLEPPDPLDQGDDLRFGLLERTGPVAVWSGKAPKRAPAHPVIARCVATPPLAGAGPRYAEVLPAGVRLAEYQLPRAHALYVVAQLMSGIAALHALGQTHGGLTDRRIVLGLDGEVVFFGRGRQSNTSNADIFGAVSLLPPGMDITMVGLDTRGAAAHLRSLLQGDERASLAEWVQSVHGQSRSDEAPPNLGPESDQTGLLDRYDGQAEMMPSVHDPTEDDPSTQQNAGHTLWRALAAPLFHPVPANRFANLDGQPSMGLSALLSAELLRPLNTPAIGPVTAFVVDTPAEDDPDFESSNTMQAPIVEIARAEAAARAAAQISGSAPQSNPPAQPSRRGVTPIAVIAAAILGGSLVRLLMYYLG